MLGPRERASRGVPGGDAPRTRLATRTATYVYCLVEQPRAPSVGRAPAGLPGSTAPALVDVSPRLWGVTTEVPLAIYGPAQLDARLRDINWVADLAVAHEAVVEHFARGKDAAVVPMKLFTMFSTRDRAIADLRSRRREVARVLRRIRGCQEWGLRVVPRSGTDSATSRRPLPRPQSGTAFLAAKRQSRDEAQARAIEAAMAAEAAFDTLSTLARASHRRASPPEAETPPLVDAAFLVVAAKRARFRAAATRCAAQCRRAGADLILTGPWPPYNFVQTPA